METEIIFTVQHTRQCPFNSGYGIGGSCYVRENAVMCNGLKHDACPLMHGDVLVTKAKGQ
jgi:isopentenyl phosphate kinase